MDETDQHWMQQALKLASQAALAGEVPVGAVLIQQQQQIGAAYNQPISSHDPSAHAEIGALRAAGLYQQNYRLPDTTLYVTLEPCLMCIGALIHARIERLVFGAYEPKTGAVQSVWQLLDSPQHNHHIDYQGGILETQCREQLQQFFKQRRLSIKQAKQQAAKPHE